MLAMFLAAVEGTIVATAMPSIVSSLGGFSLYSWVFSIYLLAEAVSIPIYGKLADIFGRKPVFMFGIGLFLSGTALCGLSQSMVQLVAFRGLQGLGGGAVMPMATTMVSDLYTLRERPRVQGALSSVWAVASVVGPALGGFIVEQLSWHWVFFVNIPFGIASAAILAVYFREKVTRSQPQIDYIGSAVLVVAVGALMMILVQSGTSWSWLSAPTLALASIAVSGFVLFVLQEKRAPEPLLPLDLLRDRTIVLANLGGMLGGGLIYALSSFIPTFAQGVLGASAILAGAMLTVVSLGWPLASVLTGWAWNALGHRRTAVMGAGFLMASGVLLATAGVRSPVWQLGAASFVMGMGLGFTQTTYIVTVQSQVPWNRRGVATSSHMFSRILGSTLWVALLGGILNQRLHARLSGLTLEGTGGPAADGIINGGTGLDMVSPLLDPAAREQMAPAVLEQLRHALADGLHAVFLVVLLTACVSFIVAFLLPRQDLVDVRDQEPQGP